MKNINDSCNSPEKNCSIKDFLKKAGPLIKASRETQNISSEELAKTLRIGEEQLLAIEECQNTLLPEDVFIKAMVRRISEKLSLNIEELYESSTPQESLNVKQPSTGVFQTRSKAKYVFLIAIASLSLGILWPGIMHNLINKPKGAIPETSKVEGRIQSQNLFTSVVLIN